MKTRSPEKAAAKAAGETTYVSSTPCKRGHFVRRTANGCCLKCGSDQAAAAARKRRLIDPRTERQRETRVKLKMAYGISEEEYAALFAKQKGHCAICPNQIYSRLDQDRPLYSGRGAPDRYTARVDHCHETGEVRGLLCSDCNIGLGKFHDSKANLLSAVGYLRASETRQEDNRERNVTAQGTREPGDWDLNRTDRRENRHEELNPFFN